jgi:hypothetical protein
MSNASGSESTPAEATLDDTQLDGVAGGAIDSYHVQSPAASPGGAEPPGRPLSQ